jgi:hypothetical protein
MTEMTDAYTELWKRLIDIGLQEVARTGEPLFANKPDHWWENPHWRCVNNHVSKRFLKTETRGDVCLACGESILLTFPGDQDGPLVIPA